VIWVVETAVFCVASADIENIDINKAAGMNHFINILLCLP